MSVDRIISAESGGNPYAKNPRSSATGAGQFIDSTWLSTVGKYRPDLVQGLDRSQILSMRNDPALSKEMTAAYAKENQGILGAAGVPVNDGTTYLAHFAGPQGAVKVLQADPNAPVGGILGDAAVRANPFLANMTAGDLVGWANKKMGIAGQPPVQPPSEPNGILGDSAVAPNTDGWQGQSQPGVQPPGGPMEILPPAAQRAQTQMPSFLGNFAPTPQSTFGQTNGPPPDLINVASLLMPMQRLAPKGAFSFRG